MKQKITKAIKDILIKMAINDTLPLDMTMLDESKFEAALKPLDEASSIINIVIASCEEGADGTWDCSTDEGKESFNDMITLLDEAKDKLK